MSAIVGYRSDASASAGLQQVLSAQAEIGKESPESIWTPSENPDVVKAECDSFTLSSFTSTDAWTLGHLLYARLLPFSKAKPTMISIALANSSQVVFQCAVGAGTAPDNEMWVRRKRNTVLRFGTSSWYQHCKYAGDEEAFRNKFGMSQEQAQDYAIHGGAVPIRVPNVEGIVAVVVVSGLKQHEDHGVIVDTIRRYWEFRNSDSA
ncbi:hypothetical protein GGR56DRAFT_643391 [Xylariaceae sp. FL0804]|nr:hypothetical protein GGR56DRAFT_643391 [Xylariaceae sp. FL0804]